MSRSLNRLPHNTFASTLRTLDTEEDELKGAFQAFGQASIITNRIFSSATYDAVFIPSSVPGTMVVHRIDIEFIPDETKFGGAFCHRLEIKCTDSTGAIVNGNPTWLKRLPIVNGRQRWSFHYVSYGNAAELLRMKFYFFATGSGTFTSTVVT